MSEAKKLVPENLAESGVPEPLVYGPVGPEVHLRTVSAAVEELGLPALDQRPLAEMPPEPETALLTMHRPKLRAAGRGRSVLLLFLFGVVAFACGIALASAVLTGMLDLQSGWVKDMLHVVKDLLRHKPT